MLDAVDAVVDRIADAHVGVRALGEPATMHLPVLRIQEHRAVGLVPGQPKPHGRDDRAVRVLERAAVALCRRDREVLQVLRPRRRVLRRPPAICPGGRGDDREEHLDLVLRGVLDGLVVDRPVVRRVGGIRGLQRALRLRNTDRPAPPEGDPDNLRAQVVQDRESLLGGPERHRVVVQSDAERPGRAVLAACGRAGGDQSGDENRRER